jgi:hypothetical protein
MDFKELPGFGYFTTKSTKKTFVVFVTFFVTFVVSSLQRQLSVDE